MRTLCRAGEHLECRTYPGLDHVPLVEASSPLIPYLLSWTEDRFEDKPSPDNCGGSPLPSLFTGIDA